MVLVVKNSSLIMLFELFSIASPFY